MKYSLRNSEIILRIHLKEIEKILNDPSVDLVFKERLVSELDKYSDYEAELSKTGSLLNIIQKLT